MSSLKLTSTIYARKQAQYTQGNVLFVKDNRNITEIYQALDIEI